MDWRFETAGPTGECKAFGVNLFKYPWRDCRETAIVTDPRHGAEKVFHVYEVEIDGVVRGFAGGEFSNGVFGMYLPEKIVSNFRKQAALLLQESHPTKLLIKGVLLFPKLLIF